MQMDGRNILNGTQPHGAHTSISQTHINRNSMPSQHLNTNTQNNSSTAGGSGGTGLGDHHEAANSVMQMDGRNILNGTQPHGTHTAISQTHINGNSMPSQHLNTNTQNNSSTGHKITSQQQNHQLKIKRAIQVIKSDEIKTAEGETLKELKTVHQSLGNPSLEKVLCNNDNKDLPILVFSVVGRTRVGKSTLLNLMIKYFESEDGTENWMTGVLPPDTGFKWKSGLSSTTIGMWIWPKIYRRKISDGSEVGILLLDNQGMFDGIATDGEAIAVSGISTFLSYIQLYNVDKLITGNELETLESKLGKGIEKLDSIQKRDVKNKYERNNYKLMFVVRNWIYEDSHPFGLEGGKNYIKEVENKYNEIWSYSKRHFEMECALLPDPGSNANKKEFTDRGNLSVLDETFLRVTKQFISDLFKPENLKPPGIRLTGEAIWNILINADGYKADDSDSFLNVHTGHSNFLYEQNLIKQFSVRTRDNTDLKEMKSIMGEILKEGERLFSGKSKPKFEVELNKALAQMMNSVVIKKVTQNYKEAFSSKFGTNLYHKNMWQGIESQMKEYICGDNATRILAKEKIVQNTAGIYYKKLGTEVHCQFEKEIADVKELELLAGLDEKFVKKYIKCGDFENQVDATIVHPIFLMHLHNLECMVAKSLLKKVEKLTGASGCDDARRKQLEYKEAFNLLKKGNASWDSTPKEFLYKKIGYATYGIPKNHQTQNGEAKYSGEEDKIINTITDSIISLTKSDEVKFSCVFVTYQDKSHVENIDKIASIPVFFIQSDKSKIEYIDTNCAVYEDWKDVVLTSNAFPPDVVICYPLHGRYNTENYFTVGFSKTAASKLTSKAAKVGDKVEQGVAIGAGLAGGAALLIPAAPVLVPIAIVGAGAAGAYSLCRSVYKICDKRKHKQPIKGELSNITFNVFVVAGMGILRVAEPLVAASKLVQGMSCIKGIISLFPSKDNMIQLLDDICDYSSMLLFYYNAQAPSEVIELIRKALKIDKNEKEVDVLKSLVKLNAIGYSVHKNDVIVVEKHVSEEVASLIITLLKTINPDVKNVSLLIKDISCDCQALMPRMPISQRSDSLKSIESNMSELLKSLKDESDKILNAFIELAKNKINVDSHLKNQFISNIRKGNKQHFSLSLRNLIRSLLREIRKVDLICTDIEHKPVSLINGSLKCHLLEEVIRKITLKSEQNELTCKSKSDIVKCLDGFLQQILDLLLSKAEPNWTCQHYAKCLSLITEQIMQLFAEEITKLEECLKCKSNPTCYHLHDIYREIGLKGNYGKELLQIILDKFEIDKIKNIEVEKCTLTKTPVISDINFYYYYIDRPCGDKMELLRKLSNICNYSFEHFGLNNLDYLEPKDDAVDSSSYLIYSDNQLGLMYKFTSPNGNE